MKKSIFYVTLFGLFFHFSNNFLYSQTFNDTILFWNAEQKLRWDDFRGNPDDSSSFKAKSAVGIWVEYFWVDDLLNCDVIVKFNRLKSWTKDTLHYDLLLHEQLHFDIAELYARKMRAGINNLRHEFETEDHGYVELINQHLDKFYKMTVKYDNETFHGIIKVRQERWAQEVDKELLELNEYVFDYEKYIDK